MANLLLRSALVLVVLFGLLFAIGVVIITALHLPLWAGVVFAVGIVLLQYLLGPWILELIYKIDWRDPPSIEGGIGQYVVTTCAARKIPVPRLGMILDGNPNAFSFGHYPGDARLVVTTGLVSHLNQGEREAVVAHELGHIAHWDFVVMTVAAVVPLVLYMFYRLTLGRRSDRRGKDSSGYLALVGIVSFIAYLVSQYIVLLLSRVREYYADRFAGEVTGDPEILSTALVKVAYGMASAAKEDQKKDDLRAVAGRAFGIFDPKAAQNLALTSAAHGAVSTETMENAMKWDLWNPWASFFELGSTHPLPAKRIRALERQTEAQGKVAHYSFRAVQLESYWDEFLVDLFVNYLPLLAFLLGAGLSLLLAGQLWFLADPAAWLAPIGLILLFTCAGFWLKRRFSYRPGFDDKRTVSSLVSEVKVSAVRCIPCTIEGKIIGRGVPGLFYSEDLVLEDETGFMVVDYRQPLRFLEVLFGIFKAQDLVGRQGSAVGWYRRSPRPHLELRRLIMKGGKTVTAYVYPVTQFLVYAGLVAGAVMLALHYLL